MEKPRKLPSGRWQARVTDANGQRLSLDTHATKREAEAAIRQYYEDSDGGTVDISITFADYAEIVIRARRGEASEQTLKNEERYIRKWLVPHFGAMKLVDIRMTTVKAWFNSLEHGAGRRSAYIALQTVLEHALQDRIIRVKPRVKGATEFTTSRKPLYSTEQIHAVLDGLPDYARTFYLVQWGGGLRISEALGLDWDAVDLDQGVIDVRQQFYKGELTTRLKTAASHRKVALTEDALEALRALRKAQPSIGKAPVFVDPRTGERLRINRAYALWRAARAETETPEIVPHALRRNDLTTYREVVGGDMVKTMARGGHSDHRTALTYQRTETDVDLDVMRALSEAKRRSS